jgi:hypothetical protein
MNSSKTSLILLTCALLLGAPPAAQAAAATKDLLQSEMDYAQQAIEQRCAAQATAQSPANEEDDNSAANDAAYQACVKPYVQGIQELLAEQRDAGVSATLWGDCRRISDFAQNQDFHAWASCIVARKQAH